ncbi:hypothetical protein H4582DRAFT_1903921, partial [Lactarius indigo]
FQRKTLTLHIWPSKWGYPLPEPSCIAAAFYLQLALPGCFSNPRVHQPRRQLPYLTHGHHVVAPLSSIIKYVAALSPTSVPPVAEGDASEPAFSADVDVLLDPSERAQPLGDLVSYYVPRRIREVHQARLETNGLWTTLGNEPEEESPKRFGEKKEPKKEDSKQKFKSAFQRERVLEKSRAAFGIYSRLLGDKNFFFYDRPTTLDLVLAAHVLLLVQAPLPDTLLSSLLSSSYPTLLLHARRVLETAAPSPRVLPPEQYSLSALIPYPSFRAWWSEPRPQKSEEEKRFERMRWQWIGLAVLGSISYWFVWGTKVRFLAIIVGDETEHDDVDEDEDGVDESDDGGGDEDEDDGKAEAG